MSGVSGETCARTPDPNARSSVTVSRRRTKEVTQIMKALLNRDSVWPAGIQTCLAVATSGSTAQLAAVDDNQSILLIWTLPLP
jgi:hypothetical protein